MKFDVLDTERIYRRLLAEPEAAAREAIFLDELVAPFAGLVQMFGGGDGVAMFRPWGMSPDQFGDGNRQQMSDILDKLAAAHAWERAAQALDKGWAAFAPFADRIPLERITFALCVADMSNAPWTRGYTGFGGIPGWIMTVYGMPDDYNLARVEAATVHELHHNLGGAAGAVFGRSMNDVTVGEYMIGEGLAESFSAELYGEELTGPWVTEFDDSNLEQTKAIFRDALDVSGFDRVRGYIFGDLVAGPMGLPKTGVPPLAGYALGYRVVQQYLRRTGKSVPEATFVPAREIIAESGFFEN
jgi:uncharacterized protein YjaZ